MNRFDKPDDIRLESSGEPLSYRLAAEIQRLQATSRVLMIGLTQREMLNLAQSLAAAALALPLTPDDHQKAAALSDHLMGQLDGYPALRQMVENQWRVANEIAATRHVGEGAPELD